MPRLCPARLAIAAALLAAAIVPASAPAATFRTIGNGYKPGVAVDPAGTAYLAWYGPEAADPNSLRFCRLPRGASTCDTLPGSATIATPGTTLSRPFVVVDGDRVRVVSYRYGLGGSPFSQVYEFISTNRGATFDSGRPIGSPAFDEGVVGPGDTLSVATNADSGGLIYQDMPLDGSTPSPAARTDIAVLSTDHPYNGTVGLADAATPVAVFAAGNSQAQTRHYGGTGSINDESNWTPAADLGYADYPKLAGGPSGLFLLLGAQNGSLLARRFDGSGFAPGATVLDRGSASGDALTQDASGRLHAVFARGEADGLHLYHATSDDGTSWRSGSLLIQSDGGFGDLRDAVAPDHVGVAAWWTSAAGGVKQIRVAAIGPDAPAAPTVTPIPTPIAIASKPAPRLPSKAPASARRRHGKVRVTVKGTLVLPSSVSRTQGCGGTIAASLKRGKKALVKSTLKLTRSCAFARVIVLSRVRSKRLRSLSLTLRFTGNGALAPVQRTYTLKVHK